MPSRFGLKDQRSPAARVKIWLIVGCLTLNVFVVGMVALVLRESFEQYTTRAQTTVETFSRILEEDLSGAFDSIDLTLLSAVDEVRRQMAGGGIAPETLNFFLNRHFARLPQIESLRIADAQGGITFGTGVRPNLESIDSERDYFARLRDNPGEGLVISAPLVGRTTQIWMLVFARRLNNPDGSFAGIVYAPISLETLTRRLASVDTGRHGRITLRGRDLPFITSYPAVADPVAQIGKTEVSPQMRGLFGTGVGHATYRAIALPDKVDRMISFRRFGNYPFLVTVGLATADYLADWRSEALRFGGLAILFALATTLSSWLIFRNARDRARAVAALSRQEAKFRTIADYSSDLEYWIDTTGKLLWINPAATRLTGYGHDDCMAMADFPLPMIHPDDRARISANVASMAKGTSGSDTEFRLLRKDGSLWYGGLSWQSVADGDSGFSSYRAGIRDITKRRLSEDNLRHSEELLSEVQDVANLGWYVYDVIADQWTSSAILDRILGIEPRFPRDARHWLRLVAPDLRPTFASYFIDILKRGSRFEKECQIVRPSDGVLRWISGNGRVERDANGHPLRMVGTILDITDRKQAEERIEFLAAHDALTGLPNRLLGRERLRLAVTRADRLRSKAALMFLDLDHFKKVNDSLGHSIGDGLLKAVVDRLRQCVRDSDTICRQGGDEFLIVLDDVRSLEAMSRVAESILEAISAPFEIDGFELFITASIGISTYPDDASDFETLFKRADTAMYHAKESGRNAYRYFTERMNNDANEYLCLRNALRRGIENQEFTLYYQPQIDLADGSIIGAEALLRWTSPELGAIPPGRFIPVAEDSGLIVPIGRWVLEEACRQAAVWHANGLSHLVVAVNLSAVQFRRDGLLQSVLAALEKSGLDPTCLELELTESILIKDTEAVLQTVKQLKALGIKLSIDDFGTGYSSLAYLKRFDVDKLKIDQSFIRNMKDNPSDGAIVNAIMRMGRSLGLRIIAEGVEEEDVLEFLRSNGCDEVQGYLFGKPMPATDLEQLILSAEGKIERLQVLCRN